MGESPGKNSEDCIGYMILKIFGVALAMHLGLRNEHFHFWFLFFSCDTFGTFIGLEFFFFLRQLNWLTEWLVTYSGKKWFVTHLIPFSGHWEGSKRCWVNVYGYSNPIILILSHRRSSLIVGKIWIASVNFSTQCRNRKCVYKWWACFFLPYIYIYVYVYRRMKFCFTRTASSLHLCHVQNKKPFRLATLKGIMETGPHVHE